MICEACIVLLKCARIWEEPDLRPRSLQPLHRATAEQRSQLPD